MGETKGELTMEWSEVWPILALVGAVAVSLGLLLWKRPDKVATIRINLLWVSTLVALLTLTFGAKLIGLLEKRVEGVGTNTLEIVLSSLVGVGIGGLIAIAGQLVQDSDQDSKRSKSSDTEQ